MPTALLSVWDKTNLVELARRLAGAGWELIASDGTARALEEAGLRARPVAQVTGEPEVLGGRVKTLHPAIHAGLLARDTQADREALAARGWGFIDLVAANLYPFEQVAARREASFEAAIENIDIGGVALLRAAAKNHARVCALCDPADYPEDLRSLQEADYRLRMAAKAFAYTARYDASIQATFAERAGAPEPLNLRLYPVQSLRYGENPHQSASLYSREPDGKPLGGQLLQGKALSYNNLLDLDTAWRAALAFEEPAAAIVKHLSPCGIATARTPAGAVEQAIRSDPVSAFGSAIACNREVDEEFVQRLGDLFVECIAAPRFSGPARERLGAHPNLRLLQIHEGAARETHELRSILGGFLRQTVDAGELPEAGPWQATTRREPTEAEMRKLHFAWKACQYVRSNAIVLADGDEEANYTVGIGGGQPNRVDCVRIASERAGRRARGSVLASDAFFPFPDSVEAAAQLGVTAIVQPGGSRRDEQAIAAADAAGLAMVFTGVRHFRH